MKHKIFAQFLLLLCLVISCSEVPVQVTTAEHSTDEAQDEKIDAIPNTKTITERFQNPAVFAVASPEQRAAFLQAERLFAQHDNASFLAQMQQLKDYPLYPYLQAQWLKKNLKQTSEVEAFLNTYKNNRYADMLRQDWLYWLAKNQQWTQFIQYYQKDSDEKKPALQCYFAWAQYNTGQPAQALLAAQNLWLNVTTQPACNEIFAAFRQSPYFNEELVWQRFSASLHAKKPNLQTATQAKQYLSPTAQKTADLWLKVQQHPTIIVRPTQWDTQNPKAGEIFAQGVAQIAGNNLSAAINLWNMQKADFIISQAAIDYVEQKLGLGLAAAGYNANAYTHLMQIAHPDENARHALIRAALREQNWLYVNEALTKLTETEKNENKWRYWQARAWTETGRVDEARAIFAALAKKTDFYALLAADKINQPYRIAHVPVPVTMRDVQNLQQQDDFKIVAEWLALGRKEEALRQWWYSIKKSSPQKIMMAAKLAQYWQMTKLAAFTIAKADYWQDLELRFPIAYSQEINTHALKHDLDPSIVFGLIRQESVFDELAGSQVGARGLMQIMPSTGRQIAKQLQEPWRSDASLYEPDTNINYGTYYYKQLLNKFKGQFSLAAAGYNAGPGRVKNWLPDRPMAMDVWIETIPFNETRHYVAMVLSNALFYQHRMNRDVLKMADFMTDVQPLSVSHEQLSANSDKSAEILNFD